MHIRERECTMDGHTYKHIEITGSSPVGSDEAIRNAIAKASQTVRNIHWFEVVQTRGYVENDTVQYWQVTLKIGFRLDD
jgi:flavin-binding protein dodecin